MIILDVDCPTQMFLMNDFLQMIVCSTRFWVRYALHVGVASVEIKNISVTTKLRQCGGGCVGG